MTNSSAALQQKLDRLFTFLRGEDGFAQARDAELLVVDGLQLHIRRDAGFEGQTVPPHCLESGCPRPYGEAQ